MSRVSEAEYKAIVERAGKMIDSIPNYMDAFTVLPRFYPKLCRELVVSWPAVLMAARGLVSVETFQKLADEYVDRWIEAVGIEIAPKIKIVREIVLVKRATG